MLKKLLLSSLSLLAVNIAIAQPFARVQFVNNCPDINYGSVDVWINGSLVLDNVAFRTATAFMDIQAIPSTIGIAPETSTQEADTFYSISNVILTPMDTVILIAEGTETVTGYNPHKPFKLNIRYGAHEKAHTPGGVDFFFYQGSTDATAFDIRSGITVKEDDVNFGYTGSYEFTPMSDIKFRITSPNGSEVANTYLFQVSAQPWGNKSAILLTSGFVNPANNNNGPAFEVMTVSSDGGNFILVQTTTPEAYARAQVIHNSADALAATVDVYLNNDLVANDMPFRNATPFFDVVSGTATQVDIAPANSTSSADAFYTTSVTLDSGDKYVLVTSGIESTSGYSPAPAFKVDAIGSMREKGTSANTDIMFIQGSTDIATIDIRQGTNVLFNDMNYGGTLPYISQAVNDFVVTVTTATGAAELYKFKAPLQTWDMSGEAVTLLASGFDKPASNSNGPAFGLYATTAEGGLLVALPVSTGISQIELNNKTISVWPNPATDMLYIKADIQGEMNIAISDITGKTVKQLQQVKTSSAINISDLQAGIYFLQLEENGSIGYQKFIKQ